MAKKMYDRTTMDKKRGKRFPLRVNYNRTIENLVRAGQYDWSHIDVSSELFSNKRKGIADITIELIHFKTRHNTDQVLQEINRNGLRPADIIEILNFGVKYPQEQTKYPIVARGSMWIGACGGHFVPCLRSGSKGRYLDLYWFGGVWRTYYRFAVVRESNLTKDIQHTGQAAGEERSKG